MAAKERLELVRQKIQSEKKISVSELSQICSVTEETIRRDLDKLESEGVVTRVHGGAIWNETTQLEGIHFYRRQSKHIKEKQAIARNAVKILEGKNTIITDSSTTVLEALKLLPESADVTVVTNSTAVFHEFQQSTINFISTGGEFNNKTLSLQGQQTIENVKKYNVDLALISCRGLGIKEGVFDSNAGEAEVKKAMLSQATEVALLVDYSKFDQAALVNLWNLKNVDYLVTDRKPSDEWVEFLEIMNIELIY